MVESIRQTSAGVPPIAQAEMLEEAGGMPRSRSLPAARNAVVEVPARRWSTDDAEPGKELAYWVEAVGEAVFEMQIDSPERTKFDAWVAQHPFGPVDLNFGGIMPSLVWRTRAAIAHAKHRESFCLPGLYAGGRV